MCDELNEEGVDNNQICDLQIRECNLILSTRPPLSGQGTRFFFFFLLGKEDHGSLTLFKTNLDMFKPTQFMITIHIIGSLVSFYSR